MKIVNVKSINRITVYSTVYNKIDLTIVFS